VIEHPFWWDTISNASPDAAGDPLPARADVLVVGGGYTGLSAARVLAAAGARVVVCERGDIGGGASSRNGGQVLTGLKLAPADLIRRYGREKARMLFDLSMEALRRIEHLVTDEAIECEFTRSGHIQAACKPSHFEAFRVEQDLLASTFDHRVTLVPKSEQHAELGSDRYHGLMLDEASASLNPAKYVQGLARAAARAGAQLCRGTGVECLDKHANGWTVTTTRGRLEAGKVLAATNGHTTTLTPALQRRFVPIGSHIIATEPLDASVADRLLPRRRMAFDSKHFLFYFRMTADRRLLFGGRAEFAAPTPESGRRAARILQDGMVDVFPELKHTRVEYAWSGNVAFTRDQLPHAGCLDGVYFSGGYSGHGIAMATSMGEAIGTRLTGARVDHPLLDDRFPPIPLYFGRPWFLPLAGAVYRLEDWLR
jgi:glycine/D-amino acid oxidase-like deaminating enzyme